MELGLLVLRVIVGLFFVGHGSQKLFAKFGGHGLAGTGQFFESLGMRPGRRNATIAGTAELTAGVLLILGLITPLASLLLIAVMTVAIITVHMTKGPWISDGGWEYNAVVIAIAFALAATGPGQVSLDDAIGWMPDITGAGMAVAVLALGVLAALGAVFMGRRSTPRSETPPTARDERFERTPSEQRSATIAQQDRPGIPADPR